MRICIVCEDSELDKHFAVSVQKSLQDQHQLDVYSFTDFVYKFKRNQIALKEYDILHVTEFVTVGMYLQQNGLQHHRMTCTFRLNNRWDQMKSIGDQFSSIPEFFGIKLMDYAACHVFHEGLRKSLEKAGCENVYQMLPLWGRQSTFRHIGVPESTQLHVGWIGEYMDRRCGLGNYLVPTLYSERKGGRFQLSCHYLTKDSKVSDLCALIQKSDILVHIPESDDCSLWVVEALQHKVPILTTNTGLASTFPTWNGLRLNTLNHKSLLTSLNSFYSGKQKGQVNESVREEYSFETEQLKEKWNSFFMSALET